MLQLIKSSKEYRGTLSSPDESKPKAMYAAKLPRPVTLDVQAAQAAQASECPTYIKCAKKISYHSPVGQPASPPHTTIKHGNAVLPQHTNINKSNYRTNRT